MKRYPALLLTMLLFLAAACDTLVVETPAARQTPSNNNPPAEMPDNGGERGRVVRIIDGDTIDIEMDGEEYRVRYVSVNTPERDEPCYDEATDANATLVQGQIVTLERDVTDTDRYGRLLRYVYVGDTFVNEALVRDGWAEARRYNPDVEYYEEFEALEAEAADQNIGCHWTGVFSD